MFSGKVCMRLKATAALRLAMISFRYGIGGESGVVVFARDNAACTGSVQRLQRRQIIVDKKFRTAGESSAGARSILELPLRKSLFRETTIPPRSPNQHYSLPNIKIPPRKKLPTV